MMFTKDHRRRLLSGFALYRESAEINEMNGDARLLLVKGRPQMSCWRAVVEWGLQQLGGQAHVRQLYDVIEPNRPSVNRFWQEKVRQTLQRHFMPVERGVWALPAKVAA